MKVDCAICHKPFKGALAKRAMEFNKAAVDKGMRGAICKNCFEALYPADAKEIKREVGN